MKKIKNWVNNFRYNSKCIIPDRGIFPKLAIKRIENWVNNFSDSWLIAACFRQDHLPDNYREFADFSLWKTTAWSLKSSSAGEFDFCWLNICNMKWSVGRYFSIFFRLFFILLFTSYNEQVIYRQPTLATVHKQPSGHGPFFAPTRINFEN